MTSQGTLTYNGATYPMVYKQLPTNSSGYIIPTEVGTGDLTVTYGSWSGSYPSTIVYQDSNGYLWVWPNAQFSMVSTIPEGATTTTGTTTTTTTTTPPTGTGVAPPPTGTGTTTTYFGLSAIEIVIIVGIVAAVIITYVLTRKK